MRCDPKPDPIKVPVLMGPTAAGKTALALHIAEQLNLDIISCDSRQVYRHMDIGTAKPSVSERRRVRHWLVDIVEPPTAYSAYDFAEQAGNAIRTVHEQGRRALICGGTGLYFQCLKDGISPRIAADEAFRREMHHKVARDGNQSIFILLEQVDPDSARRLHPHDTQRIVRALEVFHTTGIPLSRHQQRTRRTNEFAFYTVIVYLPRPQLYTQIDARVDRMFEMGLWEEFLTLRKRGYDQNSPGMHCIGYRELFAVEQGVMDFTDAVELVKRNTRRYSKRQMTWYTNRASGALEDISDASADAVLGRFRTFFAS